MSDKTWTIRRDQWGAATAIELDGRTILHLLAGTERNESDGGAEMVLALLRGTEKLPKTADEVPIFPGDVVWHAYWHHVHRQEVDSLEVCVKAPSIWMDDMADESYLYSTLELAEAARADLG